MLGRTLRKTEKKWWVHEGDEIRVIGPMQEPFTGGPPSAHPRPCFHAAVGCSRVGRIISARLRLHVACKSYAVIVCRMNIFIYPENFPSFLDLLKQFCCIASLLVWLACFHLSGHDTATPTPHGEAKLMWPNSWEALRISDFVCLWFPPRFNCLADFEDIAVSVFRTLSSKSMCPIKRSDLEDFIW